MMETSNETSGNAVIPGNQETTEAGGGTAATRPTKKRHVVLFILCLLYLISYLDRTAIAVAAPQIMKEFSFSKTQMGIVFSAFFYTYAIFQIAGGMLGGLLRSEESLNTLNELVVRLYHCHRHGLEHGLNVCNQADVRSR